LTANPKILLLDEFVSALSKENRERAFRALTLADCVGGEGTRITIIASHGRSIFDRLGVALLSLDERISQEDKRGLKADQ
jgi:ABC-type bacteriocin/lantibiotic exporter with double-glycine peptidase domain